MEAFKDRIETCNIEPYNIECAISRKALETL